VLAFRVDSFSLLLLAAGRKLLVAGRKLLVAGRKLPVAGRNTQNTVPPAAPVSASWNPKPHARRFEKYGD
jgi:hypothetical protein